MNNFDAVVMGSIEMAQAEALKRRNSELTEHHLLWGLINNPGTVSSKHLKGEKKVIKALLDQLPVLEQVNLSEIKPSPKLSEWLTLASSDAIQAGSENVGEAVLLRHLKKFYPQLQFEMPENDGEDEIPEYLENLNELADSGKLDPVIGRAMEIRRVQEILCRRTKNNPVLVGAPGVGKTAIVEGLADLIQKNQVPEIVQGKTIYRLNMGSLMAGTKYRGEFEERINNLIKFFKKQSREAIIFIDEIHLLIGAGKTDGAMDAANLLKPALSRGELNCIGATTYEEYKKYIEADSALERRFHQVAVAEPSKEDTIQILMGLKEKLEIHHGVEITEDAIVAAVYLSDQYISDRYLPDKAIDIVDEAASGLKLSADSLPPELQELEALIRSKKILSNANPQDKKLKIEIEELEEKFNAQKVEWDEKILNLKKVAQLKQQSEKSQFLLQKAEAEGDFETASRLKYGEIPKIEEELAQFEVSWKLIRQNVGEVIARATGVPVERVLRSQQENLLDLEAYLTHRVLGQEEALAEISDTLIAAHAGLSDQTRPLGSFLLMGPSGVGKTETAKALTEFLFSNEKLLIRIDLSEYSERHSVAKLIGAPPGYVGYEKGGILTEAVRHNPYSVILFDEIEKAHPDFSDIMLQILDDGLLTDTHGRTVNFKNTVVFATSNLPTHEGYLKTELIGRLDGVLYYSHLDQKTIEAILDRELGLLNDKLTGKEITLDVDKKLREKIKVAGFDEKYGARPMKNAFNRLVIRPFSKILLADPHMKGSYQLTVDEHNQLRMNPAK
ncbi:MAG: AAA domain-containing protein [Deltaproteobacteria bacterium]|nr:AAA domain-containing protein [Deltaproteobacteria bacterium]MBT4643108.1 AAA domain-containing protein [Deltaproteobacteria bacterium]MBT6499001.1 AAA domain-containing protein [Deltaproteobacteria bacterium]MBT6613906.1 AAA domain-containing protein [Deltaproteobacteria bacterium]MBT7155729.1 AAA domain-containing protein [Deltaproteobacteria bacterium]